MRDVEVTLRFFGTVMYLMSVCIQSDGMSSATHQKPACWAIPRLLFKLLLGRDSTLDPVHPAVAGCGDESAEREMIWRAKVQLPGRHAYVARARVDGFSVCGNGSVGIAKGSSRHNLKIAVPKICTYQLPLSQT